MNSKPSQQKPRTRRRKRRRVKPRFYVFLISLIFLIYLITSSLIGAISSLISPSDKTPPAPVDDTIEEPDNIEVPPDSDEQSENQSNNNLFSNFIDYLNPVSNIISETYNKNISNVSSNVLKSSVKYCNIVIDFKDINGSPLNLNIKPELFLYEIDKELPWQNAVYENRLDIRTPNGDNLFNDPNKASFSGSSIEIKMSTTSPQYFRFTFLPTDQPPTFNPEIHGGLNVSFNTTPADSGIKIIYEAVVDYSAEMSDDIFNLKLVSQSQIPKDEK